MTETPRLVVVVVTYNSLETIDACLAAVWQAASVASVLIEVLVVDNASNDGTASSVALSDPRVTLLINRENSGFASAVNQAVEASTFRKSKGQPVVLVLLNPDCFLLEDTLVDILHSVDRHIAILPRLVFPDGHLQISAGSLPLPSRLLANRLRRQRPANANGLLNQPRPANVSGPVAVEWGHMALFGILLEDFLRIGGLDEGFWLYGEDLDFCIRFRAAGGTILYQPDACAVHIGGHSERSRKHREANPFALPLIRALSINGYRAEALLGRFALGVLYAWRGTVSLLSGKQDVARGQYQSARTAMLSKI